jgi:DNA-binding MarR family transcriptional regulator
MSSREALMAEIGKDAAAWQTAVQRFDELAATSMNLHVTDLQIIGLLVDVESMPAGQLADAVGLSPGAATAAIDRLEKAAYVQRVRTGTDRRRVMVRLTARSRRLVQQIWGPIVQDGMAKLQGYTIKELTLLRDFTKWCLELQLKHIDRLANER